MEKGLPMRYLRKKFFVVLILLFICNMTFAQNFPPLIVEEEDGSPTGVTTKIKVSNSTLSRLGTVATITIPNIPILAKDVNTDTSNFNGSLSSADTDVQKALDTLDNMSVTDLRYLKLDTSNDPLTGDLTINAKLGILETGLTPTKYTYFQGGDQTIDLTYTLPTAYPAEDYMPLLSTTAGVWSWGGNLNFGAYYAQFSEISTPSTPAANNIRLYTKDDGAGTSRIYILDDAGIETDLTGGGGGATTLSALNDVDDALAYTSGHVLRADGSQFTNAQLAHSDLSGIGTNTHSVIDTHLASTSNPHSVTAAQVSAVALIGDETIAGIKTFSSFPILPSSAPTADYQAVHKTYVDAFSQGLEVKLACRVATTTAGTLATDFENGDTIDGIVLATGDRILIKDQADATTNGIYTVNASGAPTRATDYNVSSKVQEGTYTFITEGTANGGYQFVQITKDPVLNTNDLVFTYLNKTTTYTASLGVELVGADFRADLLATGALGLTGNELKVNVDASSIEISTNALQVKALGITNAMLAGSITDAKLSQITTASKVSGTAFTGLASIPVGAGIIPIANLASGTPDGTKYIRDDGTLVTPSGGGSSSSTIYMPLHWIEMSSVAINGGIWTNLPAAETVFMGSTTKGIRKFDATLATQYRIVVWQTVAGYAGSDIRLQYSLDGSTNWTNADAAGTELDVGTGTGLKATALLDLVAGAKGYYWFRLLGKQGNGTIDPAWSEVKVEFKVPGGDALTFTLPLDLTSTIVSLKGLTGFGTAGQVIKTNATVDGLEWGDAGGGVSAHSQLTQLDYASAGHTGFQPAGNYQPLDATLTSIALLGTAADKMLYTTGIDTWAEASITAAGRALIDDANAAAQIATLGLDADLATFSLPASTTITAAAATILDDATVGAIRTTLGVGTGDSPTFTDLTLTDVSPLVNYHETSTGDYRTGVDANIFLIDYDEGADGGGDFSPYTRMQIVGGADSMTIRPAVDGELAIGDSTQPIGNICMDSGKAIGTDDDTDLITLTADTVTVAGTVAATTLTEGGNAVYSSIEVPGGELGGTWASPTIDDSVTVTGWSLGASSAGTSLTSPIFASNNADPADAGIVRLGNAENIAWEASPTGTDMTLGVDATEVLVYSGDMQLSGGDLIGTTDGSLKLHADTDIIFELDDDSDGTETFQVLDGASTEVFSIAESGNVQMDGDLSVDGADIGLAADTDLIGLAANTVTIRGTLVANTALNPDANDGAVLGAAGTAWSDLFLAEGGVINWDSSDATLTQVANMVTLAGADLTVPNITVSTAITIGATAITSTAAELNILDGVTSTAAELNLVDGSVAGTIVNSKAVIYSAAGDIAATSITLGEGGILLDAAISADGKYSGITEAGTAGTTLAFGDLVFLAQIDSRWELADANAAGSARKLGICILAAAADGSATTILLWGKVNATTAFPTLTAGTPYYISETAGDITGTQPTTTDAYIRIVGFGNSGDELFFCPSPDYITHT